MEVRSYKQIYLKYHTRVLQIHFHPKHRTIF